MEFKIHNSDNLSWAFSQIKNSLSTEQPLILTVRPEKEQRRNSQNRLYWQLLTEISEQLGHADEVWHEYFKRKFLGIKETILPDGQVHYAGLSSTDLTVGEFTDYITSIEAWATERGVIFNVDKSA